ncbi:MAG: SDR family oxidoreductase [Candidatus Accumulibacter sp.]|jgi:NAD(P)-dependent dehydrogenase (short-subunit alcohol dehydrogenase family)|nr:SDR family oxidoreductase [Accumulibacter sp.]
MAGIRERLDFSEKVVLVTGASGGCGIGSAIARAFHELGAAIVNVDIADGTALFSERYAFFRGDVTDEAAMANIVKKIAESFARLDVLVNNVGIIAKSPMESFDMTVFRRVVEVNVASAAVMTKHCIELLKTSGAGRIISIASVQAYVGTPVYSAYSASKAALCGLTRVWAQELMQFGINANAICPGFVQTDMFERSIERIMAESGKTREQAIAEIVRECPQKRPIQPFEIGDLAVFLGSDLARGITGQSIHIDGGMVMP